MKKRSFFFSIWFGILMSFVSLFFFVDYFRLVMTVDDSLRRVVVLIAWFLIALTWVIVTGFRLLRRGSQPVPFNVHLDS